MNILRAGLIYWAAIFALGFALGTLRVLWGAPALGEAVFVLIEVPVMLAASFMTSRWLTERFGIANLAQALAMGGLAFALLLAAEMALALGLFGQTAGEWLAEMWRAPKLYGTIGQIGFGLMPGLVLGLAQRRAQSGKARGH